jgi:hypothetical protein
VTTLQPAITAERSSHFSARWPVLLPVAVVALVLALTVGVQLSLYHGNLTGFVQFGSGYAHELHPPSGALVNSHDGYDGQFFYAQARDPLLLHDNTVRDLSRSGAAFRMQRMAYPALAFGLAGGADGALPFTLLAVNVLILLILAGVFARYAQRRGWPTLWTVALVLTPGLLLPTLRDLSDPLATAGAFGGLLCWQTRRRSWAAGLLTVAVLAREAMALAVAAVVIEAAMRAWSARHFKGAVRAIMVEAWPVVALPAAAFVAWQVYVSMRFGGSVGSPDVSIPVYNLIQEIGWSLTREPGGVALLDIAYVLVIVAATLRAVWLLRRRVTPLALGAVVLSLSVLVPLLGDIWSDTRLSAPLFVLLIVEGLERRDRPALAIGAAAAVLTLPLVVLGSF